MGYVYCRHCGNFMGYRKDLPRGHGRVCDRSGCIQWERVRKAANEMLRGVEGLKAAVRDEERKRKRSEGV